MNAPDPTPTPTPTPPPAASPRPAGRSFFNRYTALAFVAGAVVALGVGIGSRAHGMGGWSHGHGSVFDGNHSAAEVDAHVDHLLKHFYVEIDATSAQQAQIGPLVKQAVHDLLPLGTQARAAHDDALQALSQSTLDRASLETARQAHLQLADQASKRITQLIGDVGEILTPAQRQALAAHLQKMQGSATH
jgi:Spy/CpxP family protein refolding chaperone